MDLTQHLTDDQTALIGCALALLACGGLMWASYFVGQAVRRERREQTVASTLPIARDLSRRGGATLSERKAA
ncbi:MAG TPA: hypothetical protein VML55_23670 [Planctomycetaceae bacterium]|nr:hypothetical protein [Planctomycetaceae bacterium]